MSTSEHHSTIRIAVDDVDNAIEQVGPPSWASESFRKLNINLPGFQPESTNYNFVFIRQWRVAFLARVDVCSIRVVEKSNSHFYPEFTKI